MSRLVEPAAAAEQVSILLVDDQPNALIALEAILDKPGQRIIKASSGAQALREVLRADFAVILLDVQMPGMDGFETAHLIRQRDKSASTPIIFLTAAPLDDSQTFRGYSVGAVDYLYKPIVAEVLTSKVEVFVELARQSAQLKRLNRALDAQAAELETANRELESFSSSVSHDLRAPLRAITGYAQLLSDSHAANLSEEGKAYLQRIQQAGGRMGELIDDLLQLARVTRSELTRQRVDLGKMAHQIAADLALAEPARKVDFRASADLFVDADPRLARVVVENLMGNAWKFTRDSPAPKVELGTDREGIFLRDNGAGFDQAQVDRLFAPFSRLHSASEFPGTGIGLAIVQRIVARHGGRVWAHSRVGEGAVFHFTLEPSVESAPVGNAHRLTVTAR